MIFSINSSCVLCGDSTDQCISLCLPCQNDLPRISSACCRCGIPITLNESICGQCITSPPEVDYTFSLFSYESPVDYLITQLKFNQKLPFAEIMGYLLKQALVGTMDENKLPDVILPVPLHKTRLAKRGFNQSLEIARPIAKALKIPVDYQFVRRVKKTISQTDLTAKERRRNIKGCFEVSPKPAYNHVVIIDDVVTTGSTTNELAKALKQSGVGKVGVWTIGRARI